MADALTLAKKKVGGSSKLAAALGISSAAVSQWTEVPPLRVLQVEAATGISRYILRPDLYPLDDRLRMRTITAEVVRI